MVLYYDHLITLDDEFQYIWRRRKNISSYIFLVNRYFTFFAVSCKIASFNDRPPVTHTTRDDQNIPVAVFSSFPILTVFEVSVPSRSS